MTPTTNATDDAHSATPPDGPALAGRLAAGWAFAGYVAIFVLAIFGNFLALDAVLEPGDATATAEALRDSEGTFRLGAVAFLGIFLVDVVVAWALYVLFRPVARDVALLSAWFRLTYTVVLGAAIGFLYAALWLIEEPSSLAPDAVDDGVLLALQVFDFTWVVGLSAFGVHLAITAWLLRAAQGPRWLALVLLLAGAAYVADTLAHLLIADYEANADLFLTLVAIPSVIGELSLAIWLLLVATGRRAVPRQADRATSTP